MSSDVKIGSNAAVTDDLLVKVSWWYYFDGLTQGQIASQLGISRASVGRLIDRAKNEGITRVRISPEYLSRFEICERVKKQFGLREVALVPEKPHEGHSSHAEELTRIGLAGSHVVLGVLRKPATLAVGWGETVSRIMSVLPAEEMSDITLVSLTGGVNAYASAVQMRGNGESGAAQTDLIPTPLFVSSERLAKALLAERSVEVTLERAKAADVALIGVGAVSPDASLWRMGAAKPEELDEAIAESAVGDILGVFYDKDGKPLELERNRRRIGVDIESLRSIDTVIAVAAGDTKHEAILGALRGKYIDILVTDLATLEYVEAAGL